MAEGDEVSKKLEFMAAVKLVPPAVLEEINRRQMLCRAELGNWWERQHSKDFCLVPRDPINHANSWLSVDGKLNSSGQVITQEQVETVEINDVPTPDYAIEVTSNEYYNTIARNSSNGLQFFITSTLPD